MIYKPKITTEFNYEGLDNIIMSHDDYLKKVDWSLYLYVPDAEASPIRINAHSRSL